MRRSVLALAGALLALVPAAVFGQDLPPPPVTGITISGARELSSQAIQEALHVRIGAPLGDTPERIAQDLARHYKDEGYTFARVKSTFDAASGVLSVDIDEGTIDRVEFQGIDDKLIRTFTDDSPCARAASSTAGARQALDVLLPRQTRGQSRGSRQATFTDGAISKRRGVFDRRSRGASARWPAWYRRALPVLPDLGEEEDWISLRGRLRAVARRKGSRFDRSVQSPSSPVISYKIASEQVGYSLIRAASSDGRRCKSA